MAASASVHADAGNNTGNRRKIRRLQVPRCSIRSITPGQGENIEHRPVVVGPFPTAIPSSPPVRSLSTSSTTNRFQGRRGGARVLDATPSGVHAGAVPAAPTMSRPTSAPSPGVAGARYSVGADDRGTVTLTGCRTSTSCTGSSHRVRADRSVTWGTPAKPPTAP